MIPTFYVFWNFRIFEFATEGENYTEKAYVICEIRGFYQVFRLLFLLA